jgi:RNA polymerase sigma factor (sigma-70 family)
VKERLTEQQLLEGLAANDSGAIETIYKENYGIVQAFVTNNSGTADDARDIFQEAIMVLFEKSRDKEFLLTCQVRTYLFSVSRRLWLKKLQQQSRFASTIESDEDTIAVEEEIEAKQQLDNDFALMETAMRNLGEPCKSLLEAYYIEKKHMTDIADEFGYTNADNAKNQKYKCLMRLKKLFFAQYKNEN